MALPFSPELDHASTCDPPAVPPARPCGAATRARDVRRRHAPRRRIGLTDLTPRRRPAPRTRGTRAEALFLPGGTGIVSRKGAPQRQAAADGRRPAARASTAERIFNRDQAPPGAVGGGGSDEDAFVQVRALLERYERNLASAYTSIVPRDRQQASLQEVTISAAELAAGLTSKYGISGEASAAVARALDVASNGAGIDLATFCQELCKSSSRLRDFHGSLDNGTLTPSPVSLATKGKGFHSKAAAHFSELNRSSLHMSTNLPLARPHSASPIGAAVERELQHSGTPAAAAAASPSFIMEHGFGYVPEKVSTWTPHRPASLNTQSEPEATATRRRLGHVDTHCQQVGQSGEFRYDPILHKGGRPEDRPVSWYAREETERLKERLSMRSQGIDPADDDGGGGGPAEAPEAAAPPGGRWLKARPPAHYYCS